MCPKRRCGIRVLRKRGLVVHVAVPTGRQHHGVGGERPDLPGHHVAGDNAARYAVLDDQIEHLVAGVQADRALGNLAMKRLGRRKLQLLAGLSPRVVRPRHLHTAERAGGQLAAVLAGKGSADRVHMVDHPDALLAQPEAVGLPRAEVAALNGVLDEPQDAVVVDLFGPRRVDAALGGDAVRAPWAVVVDEALHVEAQLAKGRGATGAGKPGADHDHGELAAVQRRDQPIRRLAAIPGGGGIAVRHTPIDAPNQFCEGLKGQADSRS